MTVKFKRGQQIIYVPAHAEGDYEHRDCEIGFVTSQRSDTVFCRYWSKYTQDELRTKANSEGTPADMVFPHESMPQFIVDLALAVIDEWEQSQISDSLQDQENSV